MNCENFLYFARIVLIEILNKIRGTRGWMKEKKMMFRICEQLK